MTHGSGAFRLVQRATSTSSHYHSIGFSCRVLYLSLRVPIASFISYSREYSTYQLHSLTQSSQSDLCAGRPFRAFRGVSSAPSRACVCRREHFKRSSRHYGGGSRGGGGIERIQAMEGRGAARGGEGGEGRSYSSRRAEPAAYEISNDIILNEDSTSSPALKKDDDTAKLKQKKRSKKKVKNEVNMKEKLSPPALKYPIEMNEEEEEVGVVEKEEEVVVVEKEKKKRKKKSVKKKDGDGVIMNTNSTCALGNDDDDEIELKRKPKQKRSPKKVKVKDEECVEDTSLYEPVVLQPYQEMVLNYPFLGKKMMRERRKEVEVDVEEGKERVEERREEVEVEEGKEIEEEVEMGKKNLKTGEENDEQEERRISTSDPQTQSPHLFTVYVQTTPGGGRLYSVEREGEELALASVTTILGRTLSRQRTFMLQKWREGLKKERGEGGYRKFVESNINLGKLFHTALERKLSHSKSLSIKPQVVSPSSSLSPSPSPYSSHPPPLSFPPQEKSKKEDEEEAVVEEERRNENAEEEEEEEEAIDEKNESECNYLKSIQHILDDITEVQALESVVVHTDLGYSGTMDCVALYQGSLCLIDWKTSSKPRPLTSDLYDYPLQAVAYAGAVNKDPNYPFVVENALIVVAYASGEPGHAHWLRPPDMRHHWDQWLHRLLDYQTQFATDLHDVIL